MKTKVGKLGTCTLRKVQRTSKNKRHEPLQKQEGRDREIQESEAKRSPVFLLC